MVLIVNGAYQSFGTAEDPGYRLQKYERPKHDGFPDKVLGAVERLLHSLNRAKASQSRPLDRYQKSLSTNSSALPNGRIQKKPSHKEDKP